MSTTSNRKLIRRNRKTVDGKSQNSRNRKRRKSSSAKPRNTNSQTTACRPMVPIVQNEIHKTEDAIVEYMIKSQRYFEQTGGLFIDSSGTLEPLDISRMNSEITRTVDLRKNGEPAGSCQSLNKAVYDRLKDKLPKILAVRSLPFVASGPRLITKEGYDADSKVYLKSHSCNFNLPSRISDDLAKQAIETLREPFLEFSFSDGAGRAAVVSAIVTLVARNCLVGPSPMWLVNARQAGVGKSLLIKAITAIAFGDPTEACSYESESELSKRINSAIISGQTCIYVDNLPTGQELFNDTINTLSTSESIAIRRFGTHDNCNFENTHNLFFSGNQIKTSSEVARRTINIELCDSKRRSFTHPNLMDWIRENHAGLYEAALTLASYCLQNTTTPQIPIPSFEVWDQSIRTPLLGVMSGDPCDLLYQSEQHSLLRDLHRIQARWRKRAGHDRQKWTCKELIEFMPKCRVSVTSSILSPPNKNALAQKLTELLGSRHGRFELESDGKKNRTKRYRVV